MATWLTVEEVSKEFRVSEETVRRHIRAGKLKAVKVGRQYRIERKWLVDWVASR